MMTTKSKSTIIILSTLLLGMVIGLLLGGAIRHRKNADFAQMPRGERFHHSMERIIRPTEKQKEAMDAILKTRYSQIGDLREKFEEEIFTVYDSLKNDMDALLTDEQRQRLEKKLADGPRDHFENRFNRLANKLGLTNEQRVKVKNLASNYLQPMPRYSKGMQRPMNREQKRDSKKRMDKFRKEVQSILTPEQFEKFEESNRRGLGRMGMRRNDFLPHHEGGLPHPPPPELDAEN